MAKIIKYTSPSGYTCTSYFYYFFKSLDCSLISVSELKNYSGDYGFHLYVDTDKTDIFFYFNNSDGSPSNQHFLKATVRGTEVFDSWDQLGDSGKLPILTVAYTDDLFYFQLVGGYSSGDTPNRIRNVYLYEMINNDLYIGYVFNGSGTANFRNLSDIPMYDDGGLAYKHGIRLNYAKQFGSIEYSSPNRLFLSDTITDIEDYNFVDCSTISADQVITFNGKNYYSIGANALIEIDGDS